MKNSYMLVALLFSLVQIAVAPTILLAFIALLFLFTLLAFFFFRRQVHYVPKGQVAVLVDRHGEFNDYLKGGESHMLKLGYKIAGTFSEGGSDKVQETLTDLRAQRGIPLKIRWKTSYKVNVPGLLGTVEPPKDPKEEPLPIVEEKDRAKMAKAMLDLPIGSIKDNTIKGIKYAIEKIDVRDLYTGLSTIEVKDKDGNTESKQVGALEKLESEVTKYVQEAYKDDKTLIKKDIKVELGPIGMPREVEEAIAKDHESWLQTETALLALERLQKLVDKFDSSDVAKLAALERLHLLAHKDALKGYSNRFTHHEGVPLNGSLNGKSGNT